jgi:hypothetical protein
MSNVGLERMKRRTATTGWLLALAGPIVVVSLYLTFSRWPIRWWSGGSDYLALALAVVVGVVGICLVVRGTARRIIVSVVYACVAALAVAWYSLAFVCSAFGDCL